MSKDVPFSWFRWGLLGARRPRRTAELGAPIAFAVLVLLLGVANVRAAAPRFEWAVQADSPVHAIVDQGHSGIGTDRSGNVFLTGSFSGAVTISGRTIGEASTPAQTLGRNFYLAKVAPDGHCVWLTEGASVAAGYRMYGDWLHLASQLPCDAEGSVFLLGGFLENLQIGSKVVLTTPQWGTFVAKFSSTGVLVWARQICSFLAVGQVSLATDGGVLCVGGYPGGSTIIGSTLVPKRSDSGAFLAKYDRDGRLLWLKDSGVTTGVWPLAITTDDEGYSFLAGKLYGPGWVGTNYLTGNTNWSAKIPYWYPSCYLARYTPDGSIEWAPTNRRRGRVRRNVVSSDGQYGRTLLVR